MPHSSAPTIPSADPETLQALGAGIAATCAGFNLRRASRAVTQHFDRALAPVGLRSTQFTILGAMAWAGSVSTNQLARALVTDRTTLTRNLKLLREAGLIEARPSVVGRQIQFGLTDAGREQLAQAIPHWRIAQDGIVEAFGVSNWPGMVQELGRLVNGTLALGGEPVAVSEPHANGTAAPNDAA